MRLKNGAAGRWGNARRDGQTDSPDGADYEASTGYHRFVLELFLYSFILCDANNIAIEEVLAEAARDVWLSQGTLRPNGRAPLIGDTDGGQVLPLVNHTADDHAYLWGLARLSLKTPVSSCGVRGYRGNIMDAWG